MRDRFLIYAQSRTEYVALIKQLIKDTEDPSYDSIHRQTVSKLKSELDLKKPLIPQISDGDLIFLQKAFLRAVTCAYSSPQLEQNPRLKENHLRTVNDRNRFLELLANSQTYPQQLILGLQALEEESISTEVLLTLQLKIGLSTDKICLIKNVTPK